MQLLILQAYRGQWASCRLLKGGDVLVRVDGPYGEEEDTPDYLHNPVLALFAGGIGVREASPVKKLVALLFDHLGIWRPCEQL